MQMTVFILDDSLPYCKILEDEFYNIGCNCYYSNNLDMFKKLILNQNTELLLNESFILIDYNLGIIDLIDINIELAAFLKSVGFPKLRIGIMSANGGKELKSKQAEMVDFYSNALILQKGRKSFLSDIKRRYNLFNNNQIYPSF